MCREIRVSEIVLMLSSIDTERFVLGYGITLAIFHFIRRIPSLSQLLKIAINGGARTFALFLNTHAGMLLGSVSKALKIVHTLIAY